MKTRILLALAIFSSSLLLTNSAHAACIDPQTQTGYAKWTNSATGVTNYVVYYAGGGEVDFTYASGSKIPTKKVMSCSK